MPWTEPRGRLSVSNGSKTVRTALTRGETERMPVDVLVDLGTGMAIIGVMITLFVRVDSRIDKVDAKFESRFDRTDAKFDAMAQDVVEVKVSVARIEGYLQARDGLRPAGSDQPVSQPDIDQPPTSYRQTG